MVDDFKKKKIYFKTEDMYLPVSKNYQKVFFITHRENRLEY